MAPDKKNNHVLTAGYQSGKETAEFRHSLGAIAADPSTAERVKYLGSLRSSVTALQEEVNAFLTKKMDEDKASATKSQALDDRREEENYGEEVV
ncbi:hypothetical protein MMC10_008779 [Thelotrema lepadinum]|nr:hypothetical protein [Thelotrema lepadinum]